MSKKVLITGASRGIGLALTKRMLSKGYIVVGTSRKGIISQVQHRNFHPITLDISCHESIKESHEKIFASFDQIDILINNAGIGPDLNQLNPDSVSLDSTFEVNVRGVVLFTEPFLNKISKKGSVIMISSKMGSIDKCVASDSVAYRMSKSALNMYTRIVANRMSTELNVAAVHPGYVKTEITKTALIHGRLTPDQSAENVLSFIESNFKNGVFWDSEEGTELPW